MRTVVTDTTQRHLGESDSPIEDELEDAFNRMVHEGSQRLHRSWREVLVTGFFGGTEVAMGVLAYLSVLAQTHNQLLAGVAFSIGFLALLLGRSELFTEGFLVPVTTVAAKRARVAQLFKLWGGTLLANLVGGWLIMWLITAALPKLHDQTVESASHFVTAPLSVQSFALAVLGGMVITLMTRMQHGTEEVAVTVDRRHHPPIAGDAFARRWRQRPLTSGRTGLHAIAHPDVGPLRLTFEALDLGDHDHQRLLAAISIQS